MPIIAGMGLLALQAMAAAVVVSVPFLVYDYYQESDTAGLPEEEQSNACGDSFNYVPMSRSYLPTQCHGQRTIGGFFCVSNDLNSSLQIPADSVPTIVSELEVIEMGASTLANGQVGLVNVYEMGGVIGASDNVFVGRGIPYCIVE